MTSKSWALPGLPVESKLPPGVALASDLKANRPRLTSKLNVLLSCRLTRGVNVHLMKCELDYQPDLAPDPFSKLQ